MKTVDSMIRGVPNIDKLMLTCHNPVYDNKKAYGGSNLTGISPYLKFYTENVDGTYNVPRNYHSQEGAMDNMVIGKHIEADFNGILRPTQEFLKDFELGIDTILNMPCGEGKTISACYLISRVKRQTLILVPTKFLAQQWKDEIKNFLNKEAVIVRGSKQIFMQHDIVIMTYSLASRLTAERLSHFGMTISDELHRQASITYLPIFNKLPAKIRIGLTATFYREDKMEDFLKYHFKRLIPVKSSSEPAKLYFVETGFSINPKFIKGFMNIEAEVNNSPSRQAILHNIIKSCFDKDRKPIVIGKRKEPLRTIADQYPNGALLTSEEMKKPGTVEKVRSQSDIVIGINSLLKEGVDCPSADTLIVLSPMGNIEQMIGRIIRKYTGKRPPVVIYLYDNIRQYQNTISKALQHIPNAIYSGTINHSNIENIL